MYAIIARLNELDKPTVTNLKVIKKCDTSFLQQKCKFLNFVTLI